MKWRWIIHCSSVFLVGCTITVAPLPKHSSHTGHGHHRIRPVETPTPTPTPKRTYKLPLELEPTSKPTPIIHAMTNLNGVRYM